MASGPRIVAELGRPETPEETATRKAASSRAHRDSQNVRNLIAALLVTLAVVLVVIAGVPRGSVPDAGQIDVVAVADRVAAAEDRLIVVPEVPEAWRVNGASIEGDGVRAWTVVYAPPRGFLRVAQGFDADEGWPSRVLSGRAPSGSTTIDGVPWDVYEISDASAVGNVSYALSASAGDDTILIYGSTSPETAAVAASGLTEQLRALSEETP
jgi:hypothetical protein